MGRLGVAIAGADDRAQTVQGLQPGRSQPRTYGPATSIVHRVEHPRALSRDELATWNYRWRWTAGVYRAGASVNLASAQRDAEREPILIWLSSDNKTWKLWSTSWFNEGSSGYRARWWIAKPADGGPGRMLEGDYKTGSHGPAIDLANSLGDIVSWLKTAGCAALNSPLITGVLPSEAAIAVNALRSTCGGEAEPKKSGAGVAVAVGVGLLLLGSL